MSRGSILRKSLIVTCIVTCSVCSAVKEEPILTGVLDCIVVKDAIVKEEPSSPPKRPKLRETAIGQFCLEAPEGRVLPQPRLEPKDESLPRLAPEEEPHDLAAAIPAAAIANRAACVRLEFSSARQFLGIGCEVTSEYARWLRMEEAAWACANVDPAFPWCFEVQALPKTDLHMGSHWGDGGYPMLCGWCDHMFMHDYCPKCGATWSSHGATIVINTAAPLSDEDLDTVQLFRRHLLHVPKLLAQSPDVEEDGSAGPVQPAFSDPAIETLNGAYVGDNEIQADKWTGKQSPKGGSKGGKGGKVVQVVYEYVPVWKPQFQKKGKGKGKKGKGKKADISKCVWLNGVPEGTTFKDLMELGKQAGDCKWAEVLKKGQGLLQFASADEVPAAVTSLQGAQIGDTTIEAAKWEKGEKKTE